MWQVQARPVHVAAECTSDQQPPGCRCQPERSCNHLLSGKRLRSHTCCESLLAAASCAFSKAMRAASLAGSSSSAVKDGYASLPWVKALHRTPSVMTFAGLPACRVAARQLPMT